MELKPRKKKRTGHRQGGRVEEELKNILTSHSIGVKELTLTLLMIIDPRFRYSE